MDKENIFYTKRRIKMDKENKLNIPDIDQQYLDIKTNPKIVDPEVFTAYMKIFADYANNEDPEVGHVFMDGIMIALLNQLGYAEAMKLFQESDRWYA